MARKMRDSGVEWIGEVPEGWEMKYLSQSVSQVKNRNDGLKENNLLSLSYGKIKRKDIDSIGGLLPASFEGYNIIAPNDIVLRLTDLQNDQHSLRVGLSHENGIVTSAYTTIRPCDRINAVYLFYSLFAFDIAKGFYGMGAGVRQGLNYDEVKQIKLLSPPLHEQRRIADYLDEKCAAIDGAVGELKRGMEDCKAWKKSLIFEVVTGKRRVGVFNAESQSRRGAEKMKSSGIPWIGDVPEGWKVMKLKYLIDVLPGYAFKSEGFDFSNGVRLLRGINVGVSSLKWDECVYWSSVINEELAAYQIQDGDLIIGLDRPWIADGTRVCFAKKEDLPCLLVQRVCRLRSLGGVILQIVNYWLSSEGFESALSCETTGVSVPHISPGQIMEFRIALPSLHEQRAIADYLDEKCAAIDAMIAEKEALIADLEAYKKSLIYETVTGKREVL